MELSIQHTIRKQAEYNPESTAIAAGDDRVNYRQLESRSNQFARMLQEAGCRKGDRICLMMDKSVKAVISLFGTLKAGAAYIPVSPSVDFESLAGILNQGNVSWIVANSDMNGQIRKIQEKLMEGGEILNLGWLGGKEDFISDICPEFIWENLYHYSTEPVSIDVLPDDPACIQFKQSKTDETGEIVFTHSNLMNCAEWAVDNFKMNSGDCISSTSPLHVAHTCFELYGTFMAGASLELVPDRFIKTPGSILNFLGDHSVTHGFVYPDVIEFIAKEKSLPVNGFSNLKHLIFWEKLHAHNILHDCIAKLSRTKITFLYSRLKNIKNNEPVETDVPVSNGHRPSEYGNMNSLDEEVTVFGKELKPMTGYRTDSLELKHIELTLKYLGANPSNGNSPRDTNPFSLEFYN